MSGLVRRVVLVALAGLTGWSAAGAASAATVCAEHVVVGRLCVQPDPAQPVTCDQTGALATCDLLGDPCHQLSLCYVCPTGDPCPPPTRP